VRALRGIHISGVFYVPNGQLRFGHGGFYTGQFIARVLRSDFGATFTFEDCGNGVVDAGEQCDEGPDGALPPPILTIAPCIAGSPVAAAAVTRRTADADPSRPSGLEVLFACSPAYYR
jgi:hypothetical protein